MHLLKEGKWLDIGSNPIREVTLALHSSRVKDSIAFVNRKIETRLLVRVGAPSVEERVQV